MSEIQHQYLRWAVVWNYAYRMARYIEACERREAENVPFDPIQGYSYTMHCGDGKVVTYTIPPGSRRKPNQRRRVRGR